MRAAVIIFATLLEAGAAGATEPPTIVYGPRGLAPPLYYGPYFPKVGRRPGYGRYEVEPPPHRPLPPRAESFHREWSTQSDELPADLAPAVRPPRRDRPARGTRVATEPRSTI